jgi:hypothetical protein
MKMLAVAVVVLVALTSAATAGGLPEPGSRLVATGGVSQIEGAGGGGLTPWALITGYGSRDQVGVTVFHTRADPTDFSLAASGLAVGLRDRVELSYARQRLGLGATVPGKSISQDILGLKVRIAGDAVFDQDRWLPQIAVGLQYKRNDDMAVPRALGARQGEGVDIYVAATKVWLGAVFGRNLLVNGTLRATKANQMGLLGFGGDRRDDYRYVPEVSVGVFLTDRLVLGIEARRKPDNLSVFREETFRDVFLAWFPSKRVAVTAAWVDLGQIADRREQRALYLSGQLAF